MTDVIINADGILQCPRCRGEWTHTDRVHLTEPQTDGYDVPVRFDGLQDARKPVIHTPLPVIRRAGRWRRHSFTLEVNCEMCGRTSYIEFAQHKGQTFVTAILDPA